MRPNKFFLLLAVTLGMSGALSGADNGSATPTVNGSNQTVKYRITAVNQADEHIISRSNIVEVPKPMKLYIPNAFTPNGDEMNEKFEIIADGVTAYNLEVYNRWGSKIFESDNVNNAWDGTFMGNKVQEGVYVYQVSLITNNKETIYQSGTVSVIK